MNKSEEQGNFWFFAGPLTFDSDGTCYFSLGSCSPNGLYQVLTHSPTRIKKLYTLDSARSLQVPWFDKKHLYSASWNGIFRYPLDNHQQKPAGPWFSVSGDNILLSHCLAVSPDLVIANVVFKIPQESSSKSYYIKSLIFDRISKSFKVCPI